MAIIAVAAIWVAGHWDRVAAAFSLRAGHLALLLPTVVVSVISAGLMNQLLASHLGAPLRFREWAALAFATILANYVLPMRAGLAMRAGYYKRKAGFPIASFTSCTAAMYLIIALVNSVIVVGSLLWIRQEQGIISWPLLWIGVGVAALCGILLVFSPRPAGSKERSVFWATLVRVHSGWDMLRRNPAVLSKVAGLAFVATGLYILRLYVAFAAIGHYVNVSGCVLIGSLVTLSMFISITPASLGIREAAIVFSSMAVGVAPEISLLAGAIDRAVTVLVVFALGPFATVYISRQSARTEQQ